MKKFIIVLNVGPRKFFYSIEYLTNGCQRSFSRYFAAAHFFDSIESTKQEFDTVNKEDKAYLLIRVKETGQFSDEQMRQYKITIQQIDLSEISLLDGIQQSLIQ
jgi:hypothetical protein